MAALAIRPGDHIVAIDSGSCNILSYLTANPGRISAIDLNGAHIALGRLKLCALRHLPDQASFFTFFGKADSRDDLAAYERYVRPRLDPVSAAYWNRRETNRRRRIDVFTRNFYRTGLLGRFIGRGHFLGRLYGCEPQTILQARSLEEQRALFEANIAPIFDKGLTRWLARHSAGPIPQAFRRSPRRHPGRPAAPA